MKYKVKLVSDSNYYTRHFLIDENACEHTWVVWYSNESYNRNAATMYSPHHTDENFIINCILKLNEDNPQESIDRIKKLMVLK